MRATASIRSPAGAPGRRRVLVESTASRVDKRRCPQTDAAVDDAEAPPTAGSRAPAKTCQDRQRRSVLAAAAPTPAASAKAAKNVPPLLTRLTVASAACWLADTPAGPATRCSRQAPGHASGRRRCRSADHLTTARASCPSMHGKHITMHTLRHTAAMRLLHAGNDIAVIALWLGHEQIATHPHLPPRRHEPEGTSDRPSHPTQHHPGRYQPPDPLLAFLDSLDRFDLATVRSSARPAARPSRRNNHEVGTIGVRHYRLPSRRQPPRRTAVNPTVPAGKSPLHRMNW